MLWETKKCRGGIVRDGQGSFVQKVTLSRSGRNEANEIKNNVGQSI